MIHIYMQKQKTLWLFGDSFGVVEQNDPERVWTKQTIIKLSKMYNCEMQCIGSNLTGASQDWIMDQYLGNVDQITPDDYVIMILTSRDRFWFFEDRPDITGIQINDIDNNLDKDKMKAIEHYYRYIYRHQLGGLHQICRLLSIAQVTRLNCLRKPLLLPAFEPIENNIKHICPDLEIAEGFLCDIQAKELIDTQKDIYKKDLNSYFKNWDCRYNHLCLSNHDVLSDKIVEYFTNGTPVDLRSGFFTDIVSKDWRRDQQFVAEQLDLKKVEIFDQNINHTSIIPWHVRKNLKRN